MNQLRTAVFASRDVKVVTCPHCWTEQHTERNFCYHCGARFVFRDEVKAKPQAG